MWLALARKTIGCKMTVIAAVVDDSKIFMGCDGISCKDDWIVTNNQKKVFIKGNIVFGCAGPTRLGTILQYYLDIPLHPNNMPPLEYLSTLFVGAVRSVLKMQGYLRVYNSVEDIESGTILIGYKSGLYMMCSDFAVVEIPEQYAAIGSGSNEALGSLFTSQGRRMPAAERVHVALQAAERFDRNIRGPFQIYSVDNEIQLP
jgi:ATP-dependent protease HslVU (ClpYQ) peptidase subunit